MPGFDPRPVPPEGSVIVGQHPSGVPIYERTETVVIGKEPVVINGVERWKKHPTTGEPITQVFRAKRGQITRRFIMQTMPNNTCFPNYDFEPDPAEQARIERAAKIRAFHEGFAEAAVDRGLSPAQALAVALGDETEAPADFPSPRGGGWWDLSDGSRFRGTEDEAVAAEAKIAG